MSENVSANRDFVPIDSPAEALSLLKQGVKHKASVILWTKSQEKSFNTHLCDLDEADKKIHVWLPFGVDPQQILNEVAEKDYKEWFFSASLTAANLFFKARFLTANDAGFVFKMPEKVFKVQRRKDFRLPIPEGYIVKVEFDDPLLPGQRLTKKCLDISAGGLSFVVGKHELPLFQLGSTLGNVVLKIKGHTIQCAGEIRHARDLPDDGKVSGSKIGIQFRNILPGDSQKIAQFVFEETRKFVSKIL